MENFVYWTPKQIISSGNYPFSYGQMRHLLLHRHRNGLEICIRRIGKRLLLRMDLFNEWIEKHSIKKVHIGGENGNR